MKINKTFKFLFPEYKIIESIKQNGFKTRNTISNQAQVKAQNNQSVTSNILSGAQNSIHEVASNLRSDVSSNSIPYKGKTATKLSDNSLEKCFENAKIEVFNNTIGQKDAINDLLIAFKRPIISGSDNLKPKNTMFILGNESSGRHTLIKNTISYLNKEKILSYSVFSCVDLSLYPTLSEKSIFLSDIYKALYTTSDIIVFDNFEYCHSSIIDIISSLVIDGKYQLDSRYISQNNNLIESTGALTQNSVSEFTANGKYFILVSKVSENKIHDIFGASFMSCVYDIIKFVEYTQQELFLLTERFLSNFSVKSKNNLSLQVSWDEKIINHCLSQYNKSGGLALIEKYILNDIYRALTDYKLKNANNVSTSLYLDYVDNKIIAIFKGVEQKAIDITSLMPDIGKVNLEEIKEELKSVVGLSKVKEYVLDLENNLKVQQMRENAGYKSASISNHMIFVGNPGTGKTTIARIIAKYFKSIGMLSTGQLIEVTRADLVGQYMGHTAKQTNQVIQSALGGILFIDEAYSLCRDKNDVFGLEAIDALVKAIEDYRDDLIVILAGYKDEMSEFLQLNSGLKSRFPNIIEFEDYTANEMVEIAHITAKSKGYIISDDCNNQLLKLFEKSQIKGKNDSGNGRLVRNIIEEAILVQSKRLMQDNSADFGLLTVKDFNFDNYEEFNLENVLSEIIGLDNVKDFVRVQHKLLVANEKRQKAGISVDTTQSLNMIFTGNPGTGKTTIARVVAKMFKDMNLLKQGHLVETDRGGLVAEYAGQTAKKTEDIFKSALGGVLFIDEAYALSNDGSIFGKEAIDTLVKLIEDYRGEIVVILAGYKKEMAAFLKSNSGLESRFPLVINFPDYKAEELYNIALKMISKKGFILQNDAENTLKENIYVAHKMSNPHSGNGRMVRNIIEKIMRNQSARVASIDVNNSELTTIISEDIQIEKHTNTQYNLESELAKIIGLDEVKNFVKSLHARLRIQNERKKMGLAVDNSQSLHMIFMGNPGAGKTMIARTVADALFNIGIIKTNKLVETDRSGLVAGYVGQTALKTTEKLTEALDGVLFIDEAYSLSQGSANDFGRETIDTLVKFMDDNRERIVVILAGYSNNMDDFLKTNPGLKSRFPNIIEFSDYNPQELMQIAKQFYIKKGYLLSEDAEDKLFELFKAAVKEESFGNGRYVRNMFEKSVNNQALRLSTDMDLTQEELVTILADDIKEN